MSVRSTFTALVFVVLSSAPAFAQNAKAPTGPLAGDSPWSAEIHGGIGLEEIGVSQNGASNTGLGMSLRAGLSFGPKLTSGLAVVGLLETGLESANDHGVVDLLVGGGVRLTNLRRIQLTFGAGFEGMNGITPAPLGLGLLARASFPFEGHSFGPYAQLSGELLSHGYDQVTLSLGVQLDIF